MIEGCTSREIRLVRETRKVGQQQLTDAASGGSRQWEDADAACEFLGRERDGAYLYS